VIIHCKKRKRMGWVQVLNFENTWPGREKTSNTEKWKTRVKEYSTPNYVTWPWSMCGMIETEKAEIPLCVATSTKNRKWTDLKSNLSICCDRPTTDHLNHSIAQVRTRVVHYWNILYVRGIMGKGNWQNNFGWTNETIHKFSENT